MEAPITVTSETVKELIGFRDPLSHKGTWGYIALIGGSLRYSGAAKLANIAACAMRSGAGVVKLATASSVCHAVMPYLLESTLFPLSDRDGSVIFVKEEIDELVAGTRAVGIGMGIGADSEAGEMILYLLNTYTGTLVIDADGLNALAKEDPSVLDRKSCRVVITPHVKEFSRLTGISTADILSDPVTHACAYAKEHDITVLLKGTVTTITDGKTVYLNDRGCPGMATAGSGDVLSGILTAIAGYCPDDITRAAACAAYINGTAGEAAQRCSNAVTMTAGDTAWAVRDAMKEILA